MTGFCIDWFDSRRFILHDVLWRMTSMMRAKAIRLIIFVVIAYALLVSSFLQSLWGLKLFLSLLDEEQELVKSSKDRVFFF